MAATRAFLARHGIPPHPVTSAHARSGFLYGDAARSWRFHGPEGPFVIEPPQHLAPTMPSTCALQPPLLGELKMTIAEFYRVNGTSTQLLGVAPDVSFRTRATRHIFASPAMTMRCRTRT